MNPTRAAALSLLLLAGPLLAQDASPAGDAETDARPVEATSLLGEPLRRPALSDEQRATLEANLAEARAKHEANPDDEMAWIWVGRRLAYLGRYNDAIEHYTKALEKFPDSYKLRRHRGHRYITVRRFDEAIEDLSQAVRLSNSAIDEFEPDGIPNEKGVPRSTTKSNIWYHLALAWYLTGSKDAASRIMYQGRNVAWERARNDDMDCAMTYWLVLCNLGHEDRVARLLEPIDAGMDVIENHAYHRLLLLFKGELTEDDLLDALEPGSVDFATIAYGVAQHRRWNADEQGCRRLLERIVAAEMWPAFGHIAAEADLTRDGASQSRP